MARKPSNRLLLGNEHQIALAVYLADLGLLPSPETGEAWRDCPARHYLRRWLTGRRTPCARVTLEIAAWTAAHVEAGHAVRGLTVEELQRRLLEK